MRTTHNAQRTTPQLCPQVTVIVLTYNASWERVRATLNSIILQKGINFELIISDDCSEDNHFDNIEEFLLRNSFTNYKIISHEKNAGTVLNILEAAQKSSGAYIKAIGQGDMLFDEYTLRDSYNYMEKNRAELIASKAVFFRAYSYPVEVIAHYRYPQNIDVYGDPDRLRETYLILDDRVSGATTMWERNTLIKYMTEAAHANREGVKYVEDFMIKCMVFDKCRIFYFNRNTVFYEVGTGLTTSPQNINIKNRIEKDEYIVDGLLFTRCITSISDEFSRNLYKYLNAKVLKMFPDEKRSQLRRDKFKKKLKKKLGIFAVPIIFLKHLLSKLKTEDIMTDINVQTDFANLCLNYLH